MRRCLPLRRLIFATDLMIALHLGSLERNPAVTASTLSTDADGETPIVDIACDPGSAWGCVSYI